MVPLFRLYVWLLHTLFVTYMGERLAQAQCCAVMGALSKDYCIALIEQLSLADTLVTSVRIIRCISWIARKCFGLSQNISINNTGSSSIRGDKDQSFVRQGTHSLR